MATLPERVRELLETRTGLPSALRSLAGAHLPSGATLSWSLAAAIAALLGLQAATGLALSLVYAPTTTDAWASVHYLMTQLPAGAFLRSLHHAGLSVLLVMVVAWLGLAALRASYRAPREPGWWLALALLGLLLGFAVTGNPLPWDQRGYWASKVEAGIMGSMPGAGPWLQQLFQAGNEYGNLTLTRFHALHVIVLPLALLGVGGWVALWARRSLLSAEAAPPGAPRLWPEALAPAAVAAAAALGATVGLALAWPATLESPADPASSYLARPEWYFLPLNQLLSFFPGGLQLVGSVVLPGLFAGFVAAVPLLDAGEGRRRALVLGGLAAGGLAGAALLGLGLWRESGDAALAKARQREAELVARTFALAAAGIPPGGALAMLHADPRTVGEKVYAQRCAGCHPVGGEGTDEPQGPDLAAYLSTEWLTALVHDPDDARFFGRTGIAEMEAYRDSDPALVAKVVALLRRTRAAPGKHPRELGPEVAPLLAAYEELSCDGCHELTPREAGSAPNLAGYGSDAWLREFLLDPGAEHLYGDSNEMPAYAGKLSEAELDGVIAYLRVLESRPLAPPVPGFVRTPAAGDDAAPEEGGAAPSDERDGDAEAPEEGG